MKFDQLKRMALFAQVVEEGSFSRVADKQGIAVSAISTAISQLEQGLGVRLLHRSTRRLRLTDEGEVFFKRCQAMLFEAQAAHEELSALTGDIAGELCITASNFEAEYIVLPALQPLLERHPKLRLKLLIDDQPLDLVEHGIDLAIRAGNLQDSSLVAQSLAIYPEVLVAAPAYLGVDTHYAHWGIEDLKMQKIIGFLPFKDPQRLTFVGEQQTYSVDLAFSAKTNQVHAVKQLCLMGQGIARLPRAAVKDEIAQGRLCVICQALALVPIRLYAVSIKRDLQAAKVRQAVQAIRAYLQQSGFV